ncbi:MAG: YraN family protein [Anaerolineae bacterium]|nr:YraN family protein [Anaerolineae bacterium]
MSTRGLGAWGEALAARELARQGLAILERNYRTREGEIDLIAREGPCLVIVEVKTRRGTGFGTPEEAITLGKRERLIALAQAYVAEVAWEGPWRIDVVGVHLDGRGRLERFNWVRSAVEGG